MQRADPAIKEEVGEKIDQADQETRDTTRQDGNDNGESG